MISGKKEFTSSQNIFIPCTVLRAGFKCKMKQHIYRAIALKEIIFSKSKPYYLKWICYSTDISLRNSSTGWRNECIVFSSNFESGLFEVQVLEILILIIYTLCH